MKKIVSLILMILLIICSITNVYALSTCDMDIHTKETNFSKNEEFTVDIKISNLKTQKRNYFIRCNIRI